MIYIIFRGKIYLKLGVGQKNDMFRINVVTDSKVAQFISEHFGTNYIEIRQKLCLRRHFSCHGGPIFTFYEKI